MFNFMHDALFHYLRSSAAQALAESYADPEDLGKQAYHLYEQFRPEIPTGQTGWGKKGLLDLKHIKELHKKE